MEKNSRWAPGRVAYRLGVGLALGLTLVAAGMPLPAGRRAVAAQGAGPCALVTAADIQPLAPNASIGDGVSTTFEAIGFSRCQYSWGDGVDRFKLDVTLNDAARVFPGMSPDAIRQGLQASVKEAMGDAVIADAGEAAVFRADSHYYVHASALAKGRIVQVHLDGLDARDRKDQVIALLKAAASRQ